uniref:Uncharacterized protein n=1 Tax=viral metagenome TaxID=1070528 RepID=A0A6M3XLU9_9ZZZZ
MERYENKHKKNNTDIQSMDSNAIPLRERPDAHRQYTSNILDLHDKRKRDGRTNNARLIS